MRMSKKEEVRMGEFDDASQTYCTLGCREGGGEGGQG